jgi:hypothetical protein
VGPGIGGGGCMPRRARRRAACTWG